MHHDQENIREELRQSFWGVWREHRDYLKRQSEYFLNYHREEAEDALSMTMMKAMQKFADSRGDIGNMRAWLSTILYNTCMDTHRTVKRSRKLIEETDDFDPDVPEDGESTHARVPEDILRIRECLDTLHRQIQHLPPGLREPLLMRAVEDLSYTEIAERLALKEPNVRKRIQQAREQLRAIRDKLY